MEKSKIIISRTSDKVRWNSIRGTNIIGIARNFRVFIDDSEIDMIAFGQTEAFEVTPGPHSLYLKMDVARTRRLNFEIEEEQSKYFQTGIVNNFFKIILTIIFYFVPNGYIFLRETNLQK